MKKVINTEKLPIKLWLDYLEDGALKQAKNLANLPFAYKWIAVMPDAHQGYGMPIGGVMATDDVVVPNAVGVDIGCGMLAVRTSVVLTPPEALKMIMGKVREAIPVGFKHNKGPQNWSGFNKAPDIEIIQRELSSARKQLGTLGGGNHFIELQQGDDGFIWIMIHSGSRNFGLKTATEYHNKAKKLCEKWSADLPDKDLSFLPLDDKLGKEYLEAMNFCLDFAYANRALMMERVKAVFTEMLPETAFADEINIHHNYAAMEKHFGKNVLVHRKGATKATQGLTGIIPGSMGTSSYIVEGLGSEESFKSCSHGAGRKMGRAQAKKNLSLEEEQKKMEGIVHGLRNVSKLDEAPGAYKSIDEVMENQKDLVKIKVKLTPLASIKG